MPPSEFLGAFEDQHFGGFRLTSPEPTRKKHPREKTPRKSSDQSKRSKSGSKGEHVLAAYHAVCLAAGVAEMTKIATPHQPVGPPFKMAKRGWVIPCKRIARAGVDFRGHMLDETARAVYVECKNVTDPTAKFYLREVRDVQRVQLERTMRAGCVAVLVVVRAGHVYALPWSEARMHVSLGDKELRDWFVKPGSAYLARWAE
jgi:hypothetical protein